MSITRIGAGKRMSEAVIHGGKVYLAGFVAEKAVGKSVKEQTSRYPGADRCHAEAGRHRQDQNPESEYLAHGHRHMG